MNPIKSIFIDGREIAISQPPYVIAELSANHNGSLEKALNLINEAKRAGADAVKLQTYRPDTITINADGPEFHINGGLWDGRSLFDLYEEAHTPWEWHNTLFDYARKIGITIFSSPFDPTAVDLLESLGAPAYKIASFEAVDLPLIRYVAQKGKPMIISTGMADEIEIEEAVETARSAGCTQLALLHCVSGYPAPSEEYNLRTLPDMSARFGTIVGLSDHTLENVTAVASIAMGACIVEKHFTLNRNGGGPDDSFSLEPDGLAALCRDTKTTWRAMGMVNYGQTKSELANVQFRRSLYVVEDVKAGEEFTAQNIRSIRPGYGLAPKNLNDTIGKKSSRNIKRGTALSWEMVVR